MLLEYVPGVGEGLLQPQGVFKNVFQPHSQMPWKELL